MSQALNSPQPRLSIAVLGVGGIGSAFAYYLACAGHDVTLVARPGSVRLQQLQRGRGIVLATGERADARVADRLDGEEELDLVLVTTLCHQVSALIPALQASRARGVHFMMNLFAPAELAAAVGASRCTFGMPFVMARLDGEGRLNVTISASRKTLHGDERWVSLFRDAGIASAYEANMALWLRCHTPLCIGMESIAYKAQQRGDGASWADAMIVARGMHGGFAIVQGLGDELYPTAKKVMNSLPDPVLAGVLWGLSRNTGFRELLASGVKECRGMIDWMTAAAHGAETVRTSAIRAVLAMKP